MNRPVAPLAEAVAAVADSAGQVFDHRVDLLRLEIREDASAALRAGGLWMGAFGAAGVSVLVGVCALATTLMLWIPTVAALWIVTAFTGLATVVLALLARARLPPHVERPALVAGRQRR